MTSYPAEYIATVSDLLRDISEEVFAEPLRTMFVRKKYSGPSGTVLVADELVNLDDIWVEAAVQMLRAKGADRCDLNNGSQQVLTRDRLVEAIQEAREDAEESITPRFADDYRTLVEFFFDGGFPGHSWVVGLHWMRPDKHRVYICLPENDDAGSPWCAVAALEGPGPDLLRRFLLDFFATDGKAYGFEEGGFLNSLPTMVLDTDDELMPEGLLRDALLEFMAEQEKLQSLEDLTSGLPPYERELFTDEWKSATNTATKAALLDRYLL